jgi:hypothetical protein
MSTNAVKVSSGFTQYPFTTHIGEAGRLFYNAATGELRISDGHTPGGLPVYTAVGAANIGNLVITNTTIGTYSANANINIQTNGGGIINLVGNIGFFTTAAGITGTPLLTVDNLGNLVVNGRLNVNGVSTFIGNVYHQGYTSFTGDVAHVGNVVITGATTNTGNTYLQGNSFVTGTISVTGNSVQSGLATFIVSTVNATQGALEITGDSAGLYQTPINTGVMLQVTGQVNQPGRIYNDAQNNYAVYVGRRYNGNVTAPSQVLNGQDVARYGATAYTSSGWYGTGIARIGIVANEDQTLTNQGSRIELWVTPNGSNSSSISNVVTLTSSLLSVNTNLTVGASSTLTTPRVIINDGGLRTINGGVWANIDLSADSLVLLYHPNGTVNVNLSNYTAGSVVRVHIDIGATSRDINYGISSASNSSDGTTNFNGSGVGSTNISNTTFQLVYTCFDGTAANTKVAVTHI